MTHLRKTLVVVGHGMVGHRFVQAAVERGLTETLRRRGGRRGAAPGVRPGGADLVLRRARAPTSCRCCPTAGTTTRGCGCCSAPRSTGARPRRPARSRCRDGEAIAYDALVLATGAAPFVPPVAGPRPGRAASSTGPSRTSRRSGQRRGHGDAAASVIGGGLLGLEAANALVQLGLETHVVEFAPRLMPVQLDDAGGDHAGPPHRGARRRRARRSRHRRRSSAPTAGSSRLEFAGERPRSTPRSSCSRPASARATSSPATPASTWPSAAASSSTSSAAPPTRTSSRSASARRRRPDVRPGRPRLRDGRGRRRRAARRRRHRSPGADMSTKLKLLGVDVARFGDAFAADRRRARARRTPTRSPASTRSSSSSDDATHACSAASSSATPSAYGVLRPMVGQRHRAAGQPRGADPARGAGGTGSRRAGMPDEARRLLVQQRHARARSCAR